MANIVGRNMLSLTKKACHFVFNIYFSRFVSKQSTVFRVVVHIYTY